MPVWHDFVQEWVDSGELVFVGIDQEQHAARCRLFAQWKGFDFPILWDPFNLTDSEVVPSFIAVDEAGVVRSVRPNRESFAEGFMQVDFAAQEDVEFAGKEHDEVEGTPASHDVCVYRDLHGETDLYSELCQGRNLDASVDALVRASSEVPESAALAFRAGVALRMRTDSAAHRPTDFQSAIDHWTQALSMQPNQYIWRRRIQQYGPRMDKPYPFYTWVEGALKDIRERGETPVELHAALTPAELAEPHRFEANADAEPPDAPDPGARIRRDRAGFVAIESAVAFDTSNKRPVASVHLTLRPNADLDAHWNHEAGPPVEVWVDAPVPQLLTVPARTDVATSTETFPLTFEVEVPEGEPELDLPAYALYYVCEGGEGTCLYLRQDFEIRVRRP